MAEQIRLAGHRRPRWTGGVSAAGFTGATASGAGGRSAVAFGGVTTHRAGCSADLAAPAALYRMPLVASQSLPQVKAWYRERRAVLDGGLGGRRLLLGGRGSRSISGSRVLAGGSLRKTSGCSAGFGGAGLRCIGGRAWLLTAASGDGAVSRARPPSLRAPDRGLWGRSVAASSRPLAESGLL